MATARTMCPMNCHPTLCGMQVDIEGGRLQAVRGDPDNPDSRGFLCIRGQASREVFDNPRRLLQPLLRDVRGGALRPASWDEAMLRIEHSIRGAPPEATVIWPGHGTFTTNYGTRISAQLMARFANFHGSTFHNPAMVCWGLGAYGLALTGVLETNTKEDMGAHAQLILLWGANLASQPNTGRFLTQARERGAHIVCIDVRHSEAAAKADEVLLLRPGSDTALALAMLHVICAEGLHDAGFVEQHTLGFAELAQHVKRYSPAWAAPICGIAAERIEALARRYASTRPAMIVLGGSSMHKGGNGWLASRAIACLPGLTGQIGQPGSGFGPRHGSASHGRGLGNIAAPERRLQPAPPNQMAGFSEALQQGRVQTLLLLGSNMLSSFADAGAVAAGLQRCGTIVSHDLFLNDTAAAHADVVLPATAWLEELGVKATNTHLYLMPPLLPAAGQTRSVHRILTELAERLGLEGFHPWADEEAMVNAVLDHPNTGHATVAALRAEGGLRELAISHVAYPSLRFDTPSGKIEFFSASAEALGLPALPVMDEACAPAEAATPLRLAQGRTLLHFHGFYDNGRALPTLARRETDPHLWLSPTDAAERGIDDGAAIRIFNAGGEMAARATVTERIPAGTVWMRDGWPGLNRLTSGARVLPDAVVDRYPFSAGQARYSADVQVARAS